MGSGITRPVQSMNPASAGHYFILFRGFTLVELLVALAIFAVMSVAGYRGLNSVLEAREHLMDDNRKWRELAIFFGQMKENVTNAVNRQIRDNGNLRAPAFSGKPFMVGEDDGQLIFTRMPLPGQQGNMGDLQRFAYRLREQNIELLVWPVLDQAPYTRPAVNQVLPRVSGFVVRYLDRKGMWQTKWPVAGQSDGLPRAIEVKIDLQSGEQVTRMFAL